MVLLWKFYVHHLQADIIFDNDKQYLYISNAFKYI